MSAASAAPVLGSDCWTRETAGAAVRYQPGELMSDPAPRPRRPTAAETEKVVSFRLRREEAEDLIEAMRTIALRYREPVKDTYLRALTEFMAREPQDPAAWRRLRDVAQDQGVTVQDLVAAAVAEYVAGKAGTA
jgi:predicted Zn-dependent protease